MFADVRLTKINISLVFNNYYDFFQVTENMFNSLDIIQIYAYVVSYPYHFDKR